MKLRKFNNLVQFFGAYFHQDWDAEDPTPEAVILRFSKSNQPETVLKVIEELDDFLLLPLDEEEIRQCLREKFLSCYLPTDGTSLRHWLMQVRASLHNGAGFS